MRAVHLPPCELTSTVRQVIGIQLTHDAVVFKCEGVVHADPTMGAYTFEIEHNELPLTTRAILWRGGLGERYVLPRMGVVRAAIDAGPLVLTKWGVDTVTSLTALMGGFRRAAREETSIDCVIFTAEEVQRDSSAEAGGGGAASSRRVVELLYPEVMLLGVTNTTRDAIMKSFDTGALNTFLDECADGVRVTAAVRVEQVNGLLEAQMNKTAVMRSDAFNAIQSLVGTAEASLIDLAGQMLEEDRSIVASSLDDLSAQVVHLRETLGEVVNLMAKFRVESGLFDDVNTLRRMNRRRS